MEKALRRAAKAKYINDRLGELDEEATEHAAALKMPTYFAKKIKDLIHDADGLPRAMRWDEAIVDLLQPED